MDSIYKKVDQLHNPYINTFEHLNSLGPVDNNCHYLCIFQLDLYNLKRMLEYRRKIDNKNIASNLKYIYKLGFQLYQLLDKSNNFVHCIVELDLSMKVSLDYIDNYQLKYTYYIYKQINDYLGSIVECNIDFQCKCLSDQRIFDLPTCNCHIFLIMWYLSNSNQEFHLQELFQKDGSIVNLCMLRLYLRISY